MINVKKIFSLICVLFLLVNVPALYAGSIGSDYGPNRLEFLELCVDVKKELQKELQKDSGLSSTCFNYFMGIRDGYLTSAYESLQRAALYYQFEGKIPPGGELEFQYNLEIGAATANPAYQAMSSHSVNCIRKDDPKIVLDNFLKYLEKIKRKNGATKLFNEFVIKEYAGKC